MSPLRPCTGGDGTCTHPARPGKGLCDLHQRQYDRERSRRRRGSLKRGPYTDAVERRDRGRGR
jgi:hypothetical protein